LSNLRL